MSAARAVFRYARPSLTPKRLAAASTSRYLANDCEHDATSPWREKEKLKHLHPHPANTTSANKGELGIGEISGGKLKIEPLRRTGEDAATMRARLLYQSRKRGILESDLLLSTFADAYLPEMTLEQLEQYDRFLDENDWDIYYWTTQEPVPSQKSAEGELQKLLNMNVQEIDSKDTPSPNAGRAGEWAQTVGTFKPAYRPVPARWKDSEILSRLRRHVVQRSAGGVSGGKERAGVEGSVQGIRGASGGGLGRMPEVRSFES